MNSSHPLATQRDRWRRYGAFAVSLAERVRHGASYNPLCESTIQNPYRAYAGLRNRSPVHRSAILGSWVISRYDDVLAVARDHARFSNDPRWRNATASVLPPAPDDYSILLVDSPEHTRLCKVAAQAFTKPKLMALAPTIEALANDIVDRAARRGHVEWMTEVAQPMAMRVMLRMLAIAEDEEARWHRWSAERARLLEMIATRSERKTAHITGESITGYFRERLAERARGEGDTPRHLLNQRLHVLGAVQFTGCDVPREATLRPRLAIARRTQRQPEQIPRVEVHPGQHRLTLAEQLIERPGLDPAQRDLRVEPSRSTFGLDQHLLNRPVRDLHPGVEQRHQVLNRADGVGCEHTQRHHRSAKLCVIDPHIDRRTVEQRRFKMAAKH